MLNIINLINNLKQFENKQLDKEYNELLNSINKQLVFIIKYNDTLDEMAKNLNFFKWKLEGN